MLGTYILSQTADGALVLVDQHAAHERLTHEILRAQYLDGEIRAQRLLLPEVVDLPARQVDVLLPFAPALARLGIEIEPFGGTAVLVRALPALLGKENPAAMLRDLAEELEADELSTPPRPMRWTAAWMRSLPAWPATAACVRAAGSHTRK